MFRTVIATVLYLIIAYVMILVLPTDINTSIWFLLVFFMPLIPLGILAVLSDKVIKAFRQKDR